MPNRPFAPALPNRTSLAVCLAAAVGLTLSAVHAAPLPHALRRPAQRAVAPSSDLAFSQLARALNPSGAVPQHPSATLHHVKSCNDDPNDPDSLRSIIASPGTVSGDHIDFAQLPMMCSTITLDSANGALTVLQNTLYLDGPGAANLTIDAGNGSQAFYHFGGGTLYVSGLTISNGSYMSSTLPTGGCISSEGSVFLLDSVVTHCNVTSNDISIPAKGGGVYTRGNLTLVRSTISDSHASSMNGARTYGGGTYVKGSFFAHDSTLSSNSAVGSPAYGGGAYVMGDIADVEGSTISENRAGYGGGLQLRVNTAATISSSTISGNTGSSLYGGIWTDAPLTLANSTVAFNHVGFGPGVGSGLYSSGAPVTLRNSLIAGNTGPHDNSDLGGPPGTSVTATNNLVVSSSLPLPLGNVVNVCPKLDPLADNGGHTRTHGLNHASVAIDSGDAGNTTTDQRGAARPSGAAADIGAFERQPTDRDERILASGFDGFCDQ